MDKLDYLKRDNVACGFLTTADFSALYEAMKVGRRAGRKAEGRQAPAAIHAPEPATHTCFRAQNTGTQAGCAWVDSRQRCQPPAGGQR